MAAAILLLAFHTLPAAAAPHAAPHAAREGRGGMGGRSEALHTAVGSLLGMVRDRDNGTALGWTSVLLVELNRSSTAHEDGEFHFHRVPAGKYTLKAFRLGYQPLATAVTIRAGDTARVTVEMIPTVFVTGSVVIEADRADHRAERPLLDISGKKLQQQLGRTLAETIDYEPGIAQRSMGPAPARPVLRGLGGDRLLILEDGERTGDLSATSSDHAVAIDPMNAERIEIVRGPGALVYGANSLAGVVNVARGQIPSTLPDHVHGSLSLQGETVNSGLAGGADVRAPLGPVALRLDGSLRDASDIRTPRGVLANTGIRTRSGSVGAALLDAEWGSAGAAASSYRSDYGIPGGFVGAHPMGVDITMERTQYDVRGELPPLGTLRRVEIDAAYSRYIHEEREALGIIGARFGVLTATAGARIRHDAVAGFDRGTIGVHGEWRDFAAAGFVSTPPVRSRALGIYVHEERRMGRFALQVAARGEAFRATPDSARASRSIGRIRERGFADVAAALSLTWESAGGISIGASAMRSVRPPTVEELYSEGPHLASYAFEVGNPDLALERGLALDLFTGYEGDDHRARVTLFRTSFSGYIFPRNTGRINVRTLLPVYQFTGADAVLHGAEVTAEWALGGAWSGTLTGTYVHGTLTDDSTPLPLMPPLMVKASLRYATGRLTLGAAVRLADAQHRVGAFEQPTAGYAVADFLAQYQFATGIVFHTFVLTAANLFDAEYRQHLSRVKVIMPEPGRNVTLLYRAYF